MKKRTAQRWVVFACVVALLVLASRFFTNKLLDSVNIALGIGVVLCSLILIGWFIYGSWRLRSQRAKSRARADQWKQRFSSVAESTELSSQGRTFKSLDDLCYFEDDGFLNQIIQELKKLPTGERRLAKAYEVVEKRTYDN